jgi:hypothetical protein
MPVRLQSDESENITSPLTGSKVSPGYGSILELLEHATLEFIPAHFVAFVRRKFNLAEVGEGRRPDFSMGTA